MEKKLLFAVSFLILIFVGLRFNSALFFSVKGHACSADLLSDEHITSISEYISLSVYSNPSAQSIIAALKKEFPVIKKMVIAFRPLGVQVNIEPHEPLCIINDLFVLTSNNGLLSKAVFSAEALEIVPTVSVAEDSMMVAASVLPDVFNALPSDFNNFYNLAFINDHCIRLVDKINPQFAIVLATDHQEYPLLLSQCEKIKNNFSARGAFDRGMEWIADTRFAHYIVAYKA